MNEIDKMYQQIILQYNNRKDLKREINNPDIVRRGHNSSCGDDIYIMVKFSGNIIEDISYNGHACAICSSSSAMLVEITKGKSINTAKNIISEFFKMMKNNNYDENVLDDIVIFAFLSNMPARIKCATLSWHTLNEILEGK